MRPDVPIIMITAYGDNEDQVQFPKAPIIFCTVVHGIAGAIP